MTYNSRVQAIEALAAIVERKGGVTLDQATAVMRQSAAGIGQSSAGRQYEYFARLLDSCNYLLQWASAVRKAERDAERFLRAAQQTAKDLLKDLPPDPELEPFRQAVSKIEAVVSVDQVEPIAETLLRIPLPLPLFAEEPAWRRPTVDVLSEKNDTLEISVAFVSFSLNASPFRNPQTIEPDLLHDLEIEVRVSDWPKNADRLVVDVISVEPASSYEFPRFSFSRPGGTSPFKLQGKGRVKLNVAQTFLSRPLEFAYRAQFEPEDPMAIVTVEGQRHLNVQSFDPVRTPQSGYIQVDSKLNEIRDLARRVPGVRDKELNDFLQILTAIGSVAGQALQDALFSGRWSESKFQAEMQKLLRQNPKIAAELEVHPHAGGGITDLSFRGIRIELKAEPDQTISLEDTKRFLGQTSQYAAASDRRFGVLCVLDCSSKTAAPGSVANDIGLIQLPAPTGEGLPILVGVVIIQGNLARPSDLSKGCPAPH
ncbi:MAG: hypothetical protein GDA67_12925 [Nitrospira sp. CR1.3]|nr:hypothetical protein [Nitrospira sp. CR1.3]